MALTDTSTRTHIRRFHANLWSRDRGGHRGRSQTNTNARKCASGRLPRPPRTPTTSPSERTCNERANTPLGVQSLPRSRMARTDAATSTSRSGTVEVTGSGAAAAETAATTPMMTVLMPNSMDGATPAHREHKQVLACVCAPMTPRAEMRTCGWAGAGAPSLVSSLSPFRKVLRARFRGRYRSTGSAGLYTRVYRAHSG